MATQERLDTLERRQSEVELTVEAIQRLTNAALEISRENQKMIARMDREYKENRKEHRETIQRMDRDYHEMRRENRQILKQMERDHEEMVRENRQYRRIWIAIARKQELFDEEEFREVFGDDD